MPTSQPATEPVTRLAALRGMIASLERNGSHHAHGGGRLAFGLAALDTHLGGGLALGAVHELAAAGAEVEQGAAPALFAAGLLARHPGPVVWIQAQRDLYAVALAQVGLAPERLLVVQARSEALSAMEEALRHPHVAGVVCELEGNLDLAASRRLQLAAKASPVLGLVLRRSRRFDDPALLLPSSAWSRWRIASLPSSPPLAHAPDVAGLGRPLWRLELLRCRGGEPATWIVEACDAQGRLALAAVLADRSAAPATPRLLAG